MLWRAGDLATIGRGSWWLSAGGGTVTRTVMRFYPVSSGRELR